MDAKNIEAISGIIVALAAILTPLLAWIVGRNHGKADAARKYMEQLLEAKKRAYEQIVKERENARKAKDAGASGPAVTSGSMSDAEFREFFGYDRPSR